MNDEVLRLVDTIHRSKEIDKEVIFLGIEAALLSAVKKKLGESETARVVIDRRTGETDVFDGDTEIDVEDLGRLAAMTGKQVLFQKIREAERDRIFEDYTEKLSTLVSGIVQRMEGPNLIINLGKVEGFLPRSEQVPGEKFKVGERIKVLVKDIRKNANRVKIILSRTSPHLVSSLFALEVPEIADKVIEVKVIAREPGYRTKIAVTTYDSNVDCVGACVGVRGSRIKNIVDELFGEKIDIVRWNESIEVLIMNALKPAEISSIDLDFEKRRAVVYVRADQQSLAIGKRGQNVRLASKLSEWELDIVAVSEEELDKLRREDISQEDDEPEDAAASDASEETDEEAASEETGDEAVAGEADAGEADAGEEDLMEQDAEEPPEDVEDAAPASLEQSVEKTDDSEEDDKGSETVLGVDAESAEDEDVDSEGVDPQGDPDEKAGSAAEATQQKKGAAAD